MERHIPFIIATVWVCALTACVSIVSRSVRPKTNPVSIQGLATRELVTLGFRTSFLLTSVLLAGFVFIIPIAVVYKDFMLTHEKWKIFFITVLFLGLIGLGVWHALTKKDLSWINRTGK